MTNIRDMWADAVRNNTKVPMNWQVVADEFATAIIELCIKTIEPTQDHLRYPKDYIGEEEGLELLQHKIEGLRELL